MPFYKKNFGVWIDVHKAVVIKYYKSQIDSITIYSGTDTGEGDIPGDPRRLNEFFAFVARMLRDADGIYLIGPGRGKHHLKNLVEVQNFRRGRVKAVEDYGPVSEKEMTLLVTSFFGSRQGRSAA